MEDHHNSKLPRGLEEVIKRYREGSGLIVSTKRNPDDQDDASSTRPTVRVHPPKQSPRKLEERSQTSCLESPVQKTSGLVSVHRTIA